MFNNRGRLNAICDFSLSTRQFSLFPHLVAWPLGRLAAFGANATNQRPQTLSTATLAQCGGGHGPWTPWG